MMLLLVAFCKLAASGCCDMPRYVKGVVHCAMTCALLLQHPDLIEKRRKAFADVIKQHLRDEASPLTDGVQHEDSEANSP